jgi:hypothetical protein
MRSRWAGTIAVGIGQGLSATGRALLLFCVMQLPCNSIEQTDQTSLAHSAAEKRVGRKRSKGVVADLGIGGRCASVYKCKVGIGFEDGCIKEDEPDVDADGGLETVSYRGK